MAIKISTEKSKALIEGLIRAEFDKIDFAMDYIYNKADDLINTAENYGLFKLAEEMRKEKKEYKN